MWKSVLFGVVYNRVKIVESGINSEISEIVFSDGSVNDMFFVEMVKKVFCDFVGVVVLGDFFI